MKNGIKDVGKEMSRKPERRKMGWEGELGKKKVVGEKGEGNAE